MTAKPGWSGRAMLITRYHCGGLIRAGWQSGPIPCPQIADVTMNAQAGQRLPTDWRYTEDAGYLCPLCLPLAGQPRAPDYTKDTTL